MLAENTMTPSRFHVPPALRGASHSGCGGAPNRSTVFNLPSAKNPMKRLSGDQKGLAAPSVPDMVRVAWLSSVRSQRTFPCPIRRR